MSVVIGADVTATKCGPDRKENETPSAQAQSTLNQNRFPIGVGPAVIES